MGKRVFVCCCRDLFVFAVTLVFAVALAVGMLVNGRFQLCRIGTDHAMNFLALLEEDERRHGFDFVLLGYFLGCVYVHFEEDHGVFEILGAPLFNLRRYANAWTTPSRKQMKSGIRPSIDARFDYVAKKSTMISFSS